jgi:hypothetical protein
MVGRRRLALIMGRIMGIFVPATFGYGPPMGEAGAINKAMAINTRGGFTWWSSGVCATNDAPH